MTRSDWFLLDRLIHVISPSDSDITNPALSAETSTWHNRNEPLMSLYVIKNCPKSSVKSQPFSPNSASECLKTHSVHMLTYTSLKTQQEHISYEKRVPHVCVRSRTCPRARSCSTRELTVTLSFEKVHMCSSKTSLSSYIWYTQNNSHIYIMCGRSKLLVQK